MRGRRRGARGITRERIAALIERITAVIEGQPWWSRPVC
jgi:hypothetical protein